MGRFLNRATNGGLDSVIIFEPVTAKAAEALFGSDGQINKGGIWVFDKQEAGSFMGLLANDLPLGLTSGQIVQHWNTTNEWWIKFGQASKMHDWTAGVATAPLQAVLEDSGLMAEAP